MIFLRDNIQRGSWSMWALCGAELKQTPCYRYCIYSAVSAARSQPTHFLWAAYTLPLFSASFWALNNLIFCWLTVSVTQKPVRDCPDCHLAAVMWDYPGFWPSTRSVAAVFEGMETSSVMPLTSGRYRCANHVMQFDHFRPFYFLSQQQTEDTELCNWFSL